MTRIWSNLAGAAVLVGATTLVTSHVVSQDTPPYGEMPKEAQEAMARMEAWMKYADPGPEHERMSRAAGTWHNRTVSWMYPGADPMESEGVARMRTILGGRFMVEEITGVAEFMGETHVMEGMGIFGFDRYRQKHFFVWFDNWGTMPMFGEGEADASGDIVYYSKLPDPATGGTLEFKSISKEVSTDRHTFEMHEKKPDGSWFKHMEITATRQ